MMKAVHRLFAVVALTGLAGLAPLSSSQLSAQESASEFKTWLHVFFDREKYLEWASGTGGPNTYADATAVPAKLADVPFLVVVSIAGCKSGEDGRCNVTADYQLFAPNGALVVDDPRRNVWTKAAQPVDVPAFSEQPRAGMLESRDPPGAYRLHIVLHDNVANVTAAQDRTLTLEARP